MADESEPESKPITVSELIARSGGDDAFPRSESLSVQRSDKEGGSRRAAARGRDRHRGAPTASGMPSHDTSARKQPNPAPPAVGASGMPSHSPSPGGGPSRAEAGPDANRVTGIIPVVPDKQDVTVTGQLRPVNADDLVDYDLPPSEIRSSRAGEQDYFTTTGGGAAAVRGADTGGQESLAPETASQTWTPEVPVGEGAAETTTAIPPVADDRDAHLGSDDLEADDPASDDGHGASPWAAGAGAGIVAGAAGFGLAGRGDDADEDLDDDDEPAVESKAEKKRAKKEAKARAKAVAKERRARQKAAAAGSAADDDTADGATADSRDGDRESSEADRTDQDADGRHPRTGVLGTTAAGATAVGATAVGATAAGEHTADRDGDSRDRDAADRNAVDRDARDRTIGDRSDEHAESSPALGWLAFAGELILGLLIGAGLFWGFTELWKRYVYLALVLAVVVIFAIVTFAHLLRKRDLPTTLLALAVGLLVTIGPLVLLAAQP
ncbi:DoxX family protein [Gordonia zhaorongruii]|uniref:DoxX family protein n=1 Tax=Gordonia zhaorongruii TaxID=2597659 RepID=UPI001FD0E080|nr:DoxX family protein [Gordonia zhaorongruii]